MLERERSFMKPEAVATAVLAFALTVLVACSSAPVGAPPATRHDPGMPASTTASDPASQGGQRSVGYLTPEMTPDAVDIIPPAPKEGEPRNDADWAIFRATRALESSDPDRWKLAQGDDSYKPADLLKDFTARRNSWPTWRRRAKSSPPPASPAPNRTRQHARRSSS